MWACGSLVPSPLSLFALEGAGHETRRVVGEDKCIVHIARPNGFSEARARQVSVCIRYLQLKSYLKL